LKGAALVTLDFGVAKTVKSFGSPRFELSGMELFTIEFNIGERQRTKGNNAKPAPAIDMRTDTNECGDRPGDRYS
jgi:hypothetical protein